MRRMAWAFGVACLASGFASADAPVFSTDVARIMFDHCASCHREHGGGPFSLVQYDDARKRAKLIAEVAAKRLMPPWKAERGELKFTNERGLSDAEIATLQAWADADAPEGDPAKTPPAPVYKSEWNHGTPDILVEMEVDFPVPASGPDIYRNFAVRIPNVPKGKYLCGVDYKPRALQSAHHTLFSLDSTGYMRKHDEADPRPGFGGMEANLVAGRIAGWAVGAQPDLFPAGVALEIPDGTDLIVNAHFHPIGKAEIERARIALYFTNKPPTLQAFAIDIPFGFGITSNIRIPAGEAHHVLKEGFTLPIDATISGLAPHAHMLAKDITSTAIFPDGTRKTLIHVTNWDFNWQEQYTYREPVKLPKGTHIENTFVYDNSSANPNNPHNPPKRVTWGPETTDEMACVTLRALTSDPKQMAALKNAYGDWVKEALTHTDFGLVEHAVRRQEKGRADVNGDGTISWDERKAMIGRVWDRIRGEHDELGIIPFIARYLFLHYGLPYLALIVFLIVAPIWVIRRVRRRLRAA